MSALNTSPIARLAAMPREYWRPFVNEYDRGGLIRLAHMWRGWQARDAQLAPPGDWRVWLILAGRGWGKTRTGAEWVKEQQAGGKRRIALVAETAADARDVMVEGSSGLLSLYPEGQKPLYQPSKRRITWPNGAVAFTYSGDTPNQLRGPQHDCAWADEPAKWTYATESWDNLEFGLRIGDHPQACATTTPRPIKIIRELLKDPQTYTTSGSTYDNAGNVAASFIQRLLNKYEGTRLGLQELHAQVLDDYPGALWQRSSFDKYRRKRGEIPDLRRVVVAIDPAVTSGEDSDETGIIAAGKGVDGRGYVLADRSCRMSPDGWARRAIQLLREEKADRIIAEVNNGGDMVESTIRVVDRNVSYRSVRATRGKVLRAEPISALYEQGKVSHVGTFDQLENQLCLLTPEGYLGDGSPDRADALIWAMTELLDGGAAGVLDFYEGELRAAGKWDALQRKNQPK